MHQSNSPSLFSNPHEVLDSFASLRRHHLAKKKARIEQLTKIPVTENARILDIGCGPGLYLKEWLDLTRSTEANFVLLDHSAEALAECAKIALECGDSERVTLCQKDFLVEPDGQLGLFDAIFIGNTLEYIQNPTEWLGQHIKPLLKAGGYLAVRDLDCGILGCNLLDPLLVAKIVMARIAGCQDTSAKGHFHNPFIGRDLKRIFHESGFVNASLYPYHIEFRAPLTFDEQVYLSKLHTSWYIEDPRELLTAEEKAFWKSTFDMSNKDSVLLHEQFYYVESEFMAVGQVEKTL